MIEKDEVGVELREVVSDDVPLVVDVVESVVLRVKVGDVDRDDVPEEVRDDDGVVDGVLVCDDVDVVVALVETLEVFVELAEVDKLEVIVVLWLVV